MNSQLSVDNFHIHGRHLSKERVPHCLYVYGRDRNFMYTTKSSSPHRELLFVLSCFFEAVVLQGFYG